jgi:uncharacterized repeat protein (TIGR02543 family)
MKDKLKFFLFVLVSIMFVGCGGGGNGGGSDNVSYNITFSDYESLNPSITPVVAISGTSVTLPTPSKVGYTFNGWYNGNVRVSNPYTVTGNVNLTAHWLQNTPEATYYNVSFDNFTSINPSTNPITIESNSVITLPTPAKTDYTFDGWYDGSLKVTSPYIVTKTITLRANWIPIWIEISSAAELDNIKNNLSASYILIADISLSSYSNWEPIGSTGSPFRGIFDGNGHKITNLNINRNTENIGLFGSVYNSELTNIILENVNVVGENRVGALAGDVHNSIITNCSSTGTIKANYWYAGGIVGDVSGSKIINSYNTGNVTANSGSGGIAGATYGTEITNCYNTGNITADGSRVVELAGIDSGGIAGWIFYSEITNCYNIGAITANHSYSGGITGNTYESKIINSYNTGDIITYNAYSGGIAGHVSSNSSATNCYNTGGIIGGTYSGGIAGRITSNSSVTNCAAINTLVSAPISIGRIGSISNDVSVISNNFALDTMADPGTAKFNTDTRCHGIDKSYTQMKTQVTYADPVVGLGWKFGNNDNNPWKWIDGSYPVLYWQ